MNILFAGHDFKFATGIIDHYKKLGWNVFLDKWENHSVHDEKKSFNLLEKSDVIFCEWGLGNIVFYSKNKRENQKLVVRLHLQEKDLDYLKNIKVENVDYFFIIAPFIYEELVHKFKLPREKTKIIYNLIDMDEIEYKKHENTKYNLGICGIVPKRKRLDLALDLIEKLYKKDKRFKLYIKGKMPSEYPWIKSRKDENEYYEQMFNRIKKMKCKNNIIFDDYSENMNDWYKKIRYILSPSDFESFHMTVAEGMATGCIPIIQEREGAKLLFPNNYIFHNTNEMVEFISKNIINNDTDNIEFVRTNYDKNKINKNIDEYLISEDDKFLTNANEANIKNIIDVFKTRAIENPEIPIIIMNTTVKSPYENRYHRIQYRGVSLANEFEEMGFPTIVLYYNWNNNTEIFKIQKPPYFLPAGEFLENIEEYNISELPNKKYFICCIPDDRSLKMIDNFKKNNWNIIYDIWDDWEEMAKMGMGRSWYDKSLEKEICNKVDKITTVSPLLKEKVFNVFNSVQSYIIPNAVSTSFINENKNILNNYKAHKKKIIGYFGHLGGKWFDWDSLIDLSNQYKDWIIELIGPAYPSDRSFPDNIKFIGPLPQNKIPQYAKQWALGIIPFGKTLLDKSVDPIKVYEYLALGLKVVSVDMGKIKNYPLTWVYYDESEILDTVNNALLYKVTEKDIKDVKIFLEDNTWKKRAEEILKI